MIKNSNRATMNTKLIFPPRAEISPLFMHSSRRILSPATTALNQGRGNQFEAYRELCDFEGNDGTGARMSAIVFVERIPLVLRWFRGLRAPRWKKAFQGIRAWPLCTYKSFRYKGNRVRGRICSHLLILRYCEDFQD